MTTVDKFKFVMIGAMYENGGNTTHRFLDGHPGLYVYPFESQPGTSLVNDLWTSMFPVKYRWPTFDLAATPEQDYQAIIDEECKVRSRTPNVSKFRDAKFDFSDKDRLQHYVRHVKTLGRSRAANMAAFFMATFDAWKDFQRSGEEQVYVGYSPIIGIDGDKILDDLPAAHVLHIVRNPWSAYADTKKRPVPLSLAGYITRWNINQMQAKLFQKKYPGRYHVIRTEDVLANPEKTLGDFCSKIGLSSAPTLKTPSWNGQPLKEVYPWGTIRTPTPAANLATAQELSKDEQEEIRVRADTYIEHFDFKSFLK